MSSLKNKEKDIHMKKTVIGIFALICIIILVGCSEKANPKIRIANERGTKANIQIQTSGGNTINYTDVAVGQTTLYQNVYAGTVTVTAVIQSELKFPSVKFTAQAGESYTVVILTGDIPSLRVDLN